MNKLLSLLFSLLFMQAMAQDATISVSVHDPSGGPAIGAAVKTLQNGAQVAFGVTNVRGIATITPLTPGHYNIVVSYMGTSETLEGVRISEGMNRRNVSLDAIEMEPVVIEYNPGIEFSSPYGETAGTLKGSAIYQLLGNKWFRNE